MNDKEGLNNFVIIEFSQKKGHDREAGKRGQGEALCGRGALEAEDVVDGGYGAVLVADDEVGYDYYPVIWDGMPYEIDENGLYDVIGGETLHLLKGEFVCEVFWMNKVPMAPNWYTPSVMPGFV